MNKNVKKYTIKCAKKQSTYLRQTRLASSKIISIGHKLTWCRSQG